MIIVPRKAPSQASWQAAVDRYLAFSVGSVLGLGFGFVGGIYWTAYWLVP